MPQRDSRRYFIVKHDLDSLEALPEMIWRAGRRKGELPRGFNRVRKGDRWIAFAYTDSWGESGNALSLITGFFESEEEAHYQRLPPSKEERRAWKSKGTGYERQLRLVTEIARRPGVWMIIGKRQGEQPTKPVGVPPINDLLGKTTFNQATLIEVNGKEFEHIRKKTLGLQFDTRKIPLLGREPECEQELLAAVAHGHKTLGIERIHRVRKAFPDLLVKIEGSPEEVHLELEVYSGGFFSHGHHEQVRNRRFTEDGKPVAVLCWIDNNKEVKDCVHRVYELQSLLREGKKIRW